MKKYQLITEHLEQFLQNEVTKTGLSSVVLGLSGGIDSAVVAVLASRVFGDKFHAIMLPSQYSSQSSLDDAAALCEKFSINNTTISIEPLVSAYEKNMDSNLRKGNFSARMRMAILFDMSSKYNALVLGTSNKSELMLGYGTIYGDLASAINPIGDMYKSEVFEFAKYLGVNEAIISKPPSADLWDGQSDEADLGYTYAQIDAVLEQFVENRKDKEELLAMGFEKNLIDMVVRKVYQNQFKRKTPVIAKLKSRTINHDFLYPRDTQL